MRGSERVSQVRDCVGCGRCVVEMIVSVSGLSLVGQRRVADGTIVYCAFFSGSSRLMNSDEATATWTAVRRTSFGTLTLEGSL